MSTLIFTLYPKGWQSKPALLCISNNLRPCLLKVNNDKVVETPDVTSKQNYKL